MVVAIGSEVATVEDTSWELGMPADTWHASWSSRMQSLRKALGATPWHHVWALGAKWKSNTRFTLQRLVTTSFFLVKLVISLSGSSGQRSRGRPGLSWYKLEHLCSSDGLMLVAHRSGKTKSLCPSGFWHSHPCREATQWAGPWVSWWKVNNKYKSSKCYKKQWKH